MTEGPQQLFLFDRPLRTEGWDPYATRRALDDLFTLARKYQSSKSYIELLRFIGRFRFYSPFNAMLVHVQMPGARFVAPAHHWLRQWGRRLKADARPLVILQPMGPVMFVFDVSERNPRGASALPPEVEHPFEVRRGRVGAELERTIENAKRDGVRIGEQERGSQSAGMIRSANAQGYLSVLVRKRPQPTYRPVPLRYEILLNSRLSREAK